MECVWEELECGRISISIGLKTSLADRDRNRQTEDEKRSIWIPLELCVNAASQTWRQQEWKIEAWRRGESLRQEKQKGCWALSLAWLDLENINGEEKLFVSETKCLWHANTKTPLELALIKHKPCECVCVCICSRFPATGSLLHAMHSWRGRLTGADFSQQFKLNKSRLTLRGELIKTYWTNPKFRELIQGHYERVYHF